MASCYAKLSRKAKKILVWERWGNIFHWQSSGIHGPEDIAGGGRAALDLLPGAVAAGPNTQSVEGHALPALADGDSLVRAPATVEGPHQAGIAGGAGAPPPTKVKIGKLISIGKLLAAAAAGAAAAALLIRFVF